MNEEELRRLLHEAHTEGVRAGLEMAAQRIEMYAVIGAKLIQGTGIPELHTFLAESVRSMKEEVKP